MMDYNTMLWEMSGEQFACLDMQLYLDTHPGDEAALAMYNDYQRKYMKAKEQFENSNGPMTATYSTHKRWDWACDPWPWEKEAN